MLTDTRCFSISTNEQQDTIVRDLVINISRLTIRDMNDKVPVSFGSCQEIL